MTCLINENSNKIWVWALRQEHLCVIIWLGHKIPMKLFLNSSALFIYFQPQKSIPTSPKHSAVSSSQMQAYSKSGSFHHTQSSPQEAHLVNTRLVEELRTVVVMNDKWQKYHKQQEKFINDLQIKLQQQRLKTEKAEKCYSNSLITQQLQEKKLKDQEETIKCFGGIVEELNIAKGKIHKLEEEAKKSRHLSVKNNSNNRDEDVQLLQYQVRSFL